ncbi:hypothetical protein BS50DRAFT_183003 [Corynespora cassiicola Philippines]|uniref:Uncharacterized protein n=1 Tax=Corynespora cassiicola Philippines TaxID=1448308 RepID=A0A2T2P6T7_CORCC|nr:hypothetical protein BS50DRAFT_183003 [Corynespora cassiicola Philippines]
MSKHCAMMSARQARRGLLQRPASSRQECAAALERARWCIAGKRSRAGGLLEDALGSLAKVGKADRVALRADPTSWLDGPGWAAPPECASSSAQSQNEAMRWKRRQCDGALEAVAISESPAARAGTSRHEQAPHGVDPRRSMHVALSLLGLQQTVAKGLRTRGGPAAASWPQHDSRTRRRQVHECTAYTPPPSPWPSLWLRTLGRPCATRCEHSAAGWLTGAIFGAASRGTVARRLFPLLCPSPGPPMVSSAGLCSRPDATTSVIPAPTPAAIEFENGPDRRRKTLDWHPTLDPTVNGCVRVLPQPQA